MLIFDNPPGSSFLPIVGRQLTLLLGLGLGASGSSFAQNAPRLQDNHTLAWLVYVGDNKIATKWTLHTEYQWRRVDWLQHPQQQLARLGLARTLTDRVQIAAGYTYFQSHRYGQYAEVPGRPTPENRAYEDVSLKDQLGRLHLTHRIRLEQRWLGSRDANGEGPVQKWVYQNRIRYQLAATYPLQGPTIDPGECYLNAFDELFIGFGRHVGQNVFNQNRLSGGLGYQVATNCQLELNYFYQIRSHATPDPLTDQPVVELNNGLRLNVVYNLDFTKN